MQIVSNVVFMFRRGRESTSLEVQVDIDEVRSGEELKDHS